MGWSQLLTAVMVVSMGLSLPMGLEGRRLLQATPRGAFFPGFPGLTAPSFPVRFPPMFSTPGGGTPFSFPTFPGFPGNPNTPQLPGNPLLNAPQFPGNAPQLPGNPLPNAPQFPGNAPQLPGNAPEFPGNPSLPNAPAAPAFTPPRTP